MNMGLAVGLEERLAGSRQPASGRWREMVGSRAMEAGTQQLPTWKPEDGRAGYVRIARRRVVPLNRMGPRSIFNIAFEMLAPPSGYGRLAWIAEHFPTTPRTTLRAWRRGERQAPEWARELLAAELLRDNARRAAVTEMLLSEKEKPAD